MDTEELLSKLDLIEEQARESMEAYPQHLAKERQRMIVALVKHIRWMIADAAAPAADDPDATVPTRLPS